MLPLHSVQKQHFGPSIGKVCEIYAPYPLYPKQTFKKGTVPVMYLYAPYPNVWAGVRQIQPRGGCRAHQEQTLESARRTIPSPVIFSTGGG